MPRGGQNKYRPTESDRETVKTMASAEIPHLRIARCLGTNGIDQKTLYKYFREELDTSADKATAVVVGKLWQAVQRGEAWAICFWLKCRARWQEIQRVDHNVSQTIDITVNARDEFESRLDGLAARIEAERAIEKPN